MDNKMITITEPVVDTQNCYVLLALANAGSRSCYPKEIREFARWKLKEAIKHMRDSIDHLERELGARE